MATPDMKSNSPSNRGRNAFNDSNGQSGRFDGESSSSYEAAPERSDAFLPAVQRIWTNLTQRLRGEDRRIRERYARRLAKQES